MQRRWMMGWAATLVVAWSADARAEGTITVAAPNVCEVTPGGSPFEIKRKDGAALPNDVLVGDKPLVGTQVALEGGVDVQIKSASLGLNATCAIPLAPKPAPVDPQPEPQGDAGAKGDRADQDAAISKKEPDAHWDTHTIDGSWHIYHYADGEPVRPLPRHIREDEEIVLHAVVPKGGGANFKINACEAVPESRVEGTFKDALEYHSGHVEYEVITYKQRLHCAGTLSYSVTILGPDKKPVSEEVTTSVSIDPILRFFVAAGMMFDFGSVERLSLKDRSDGAGGSVKYVAQEDEFAGLRPVITIGVYLCGANPRAWGWCDRFAPVLIVDPTRLDQGGGLGLQINPFHGLGIVGGATMFTTDELPEGSGLKVGDVQTTPGDLEVTKTINDQSFGGMVGLTLSLDLLKDIF